MEGGLEWQLDGCREPGQLLMEERVMGCPSQFISARVFPGHLLTRESKGNAPLRGLFRVERAALGWGCRR